MKTRLKSTITRKQENLGSTERAVSLLSGSLMLYNAVKNGRIIQGLAAGYLVFRGATGYCPAYEAIDKKRTDKPQNINIKTQVTVNKPLSQVYQFWRQLDNLPLFMKHLERVNILDEKRSEWKARIPGILPEGLKTLEWSSEIVEDQPNDRIGWRSLPGSMIENAGNVHFRDAGRFGTNVYAVISYQAPAGKAGEGLGRLLNPTFERMVKEDLTNFKKYLEENEMAGTEKTPNWQE